MPRRKASKRTTPPVAPGTLADYLEPLQPGKDPAGARILLYPTQTRRRVLQWESQESADLTHLDKALATVRRKTYVTTSRAKRTQRETAPPEHGNPSGCSG